MALTRKSLSAMGIEGEKVDQIIEMHTEVTDALKEERDKYKSDAEKLPNVQRELDDLKAAAEKNGNDPYKVRYEELRDEFEKYKTDIAARETRGKQESEYKRLLTEAGVGDKYTASILKVSGDAIGELKLDKDGKAERADEVVNALKTEWADFVVTTQTKGAQTATPPASFASLSWSFSLS